VEEVRDGRTILLDPHRAFGTGQHPSTRLCLQALEHLSGKTQAHRRLRGLRVLDFGCGSGVLALAAARLGARRVLGVEIDPNAVQTAKRNVSLNGLDRTIGIKQGTWDMVKERYHIILANLVPAALLRSIPHLPTHMEATGQAVVSGFGENQMEEVLRRCKGEGLISEHTWTLEGWVAVMLKKRPSSHA
jgi:ribosomal protein L11 methyltransferase